MDSQPKPSNVPGFKLPIKISSISLMIIGGVIILLVAGGVGFWYWLKSKQASPAPFLQTQEALTLGSEIFDKTQNQLQGRVPDANPFKGQKNPFDAIYKNPFE